MTMATEILDQEDYVYDDTVLKVCGRDAFVVIWTSNARQKNHRRHVKVVQVASRYLDPGGTPVAVISCHAPWHRRSAGRPGSGRLGSSRRCAEHDTACEDRGLATIVVRHFLLRGVYENAGFFCTLTAGDLRGLSPSRRNRGDGGSVGIISGVEGEP